MDQNRPAEYPLPVQAAFALLDYCRAAEHVQAVVLPQPERPKILTHPARTLSIHELRAVEAAMETIRAYLEAAREGAPEIHDDPRYPDSSGHD